MMIHPDVLVDLARQHRDELLDDAAHSRLARAARRSTPQRWSVRSLRKPSRPQVAPARRRPQIASAPTGPQVASQTRPEAASASRAAAPAAHRPGGSGAVGRVGTLAACAPAAAE